MRRLLKNCKILIRTNEGYKVLTNAYLGIDKDTIDYIAEKYPTKKYDEEKDMEGKLIMPGLINAHGHSPMTLLRGVGSGLKLQDWLNNAVFPIEEKLVPQDILIGCKLAIMEMLSTGTTTFAEMYDFPYASAYAIAESGIKSNLCRVGFCLDPNIEGEDDERTIECIEFIDSFYNRDFGNTEAIRELDACKKDENYIETIVNAIDKGRLKADFCLHSEYLTTPNVVKAMADENKRLKDCVQVHVSETKQEHNDCIERHGKTPIKYFNDIGILDNNTYAAHCVWVTDEDLEIMKERNVTLVHNPSSNMKLGSGFAPITKALDMGINIALGTDGCASNNNLNMFEEMHLAALIHKGFKNDPIVLSATQILDMATINGAKAMGREDTGVIEVGKKADIIAINMDKPHLYPALDIPNLIVYSMQGSDVCMTMVDGKILYENGKFLTIDKEKTLKEAEVIIKRLFLR